MDAYSPFPIQGLADALGHKRSSIPVLVLPAGIACADSAVTSWNGLRWRRIIPSTLRAALFSTVGPPSFQLLSSWTVLCAALTAIISMLAFNRLPQPCIIPCSTSRVSRARQRTASFSALNPAILPLIALKLKNFSSRSTRPTSRRCLRENKRSSARVDDNCSRLSPRNVRATKGRCAQEQRFFCQWRGVASPAPSYRGPRKISTPTNPYDTGEIGTNFLARIPFPGHARGPRTRTRTIRYLLRRLPRQEPARAPASSSNADSLAPRFHTTSSASATRRPGYFSASCNARPRRLMFSCESCQY